MECVILIGLPAAGKSSFYRERFAGTHDHVSKDLMRHHQHPQRRQDLLIADALAAGRSVVVDNTNPSVEVRASIIALARRHGADVVGYYFPTEAGDALRRNKARSGRESVPAVAIFTTRKKLVPPAYAEGFDRIYIVTMVEAERRFDVRELPR